MIVLSLLCVIISISWGLRTADQSCKDARFNLVSRVVFDVAMGVSLLTGELIVCEVSDWLSPGIRSVLWRLAIRVLLGLTTVVIPYVDGCLWIHHFIGGGRVFAVPVVIVWWIVVYKIGGATSTTTTTQDIEGWLLLRVGLIGISVTAVLSAFACITTPFHTHRRSSIFTKASSVYCIYRLVSTCVIYNPLIISSSSQAAAAAADPVTRGVALFANLYDGSINVEGWTRQIGFLLTGIVLSTSMTNVMTISNRFKTHLPDNPASRLLFAQFVGMYGLSTTLLLSTSLPSSQRTSMHHVDDLVDPTQLDRWFDLVFIFACVVSGVFVYIGTRKKKSPSPQQPPVDLEMGLNLRKVD